MRYLDAGMAKAKHWCKASAFVDDRTVRTKTVPAFTDAIRFTRIFGNVMGQQLNVDKSFGFATKPTHRKQIAKLKFGGKSFKTTNDAPNLGAQLTTRHGAVHTTKINDSIKATHATLDPIHKTPMPVPAKCYVLAAKAIPQLLYGN